MPKAKPLRVRQYAHIHNSDFLFERHGDAKKFRGMINVCVARAERALETPANGYSKLQRDQIADIFRSMKATHGAIERLLDFDAPIDAETVDVLALARLQLECLFAICLMVEDSKYVTDYTQDYWRKKYVRFLLDREETRNLPRLAPHFDSGEALQMLMNLAAAFGITQAQIATVDEDEIGTPLPAGLAREDLASFPTPGRVIPKIASSPEKKRMLQRLHAKYGDLCSFAHGLGEANLLKIMFNNRSGFRRLASDGQIKERYELDVKSESFMTSFLSIAQATAELTTLYPNDMEIVKIAIEAWGELAVGSLITKAVWEIRTRKLLGAIA